MVASPEAREGRPPAGWYDDPGRRHHLRYWDGGGWTPGVADGVTITEDPLPEPGAEPERGDPDRGAQLPGRAVGVAVVGVMVGIGLAQAIAALVLAAAPDRR